MRNRVRLELRSAVDELYARSRPRPAPPPPTQNPGPVAGNGLEFLRSTTATQAGDYQFLAPLGGGADDWPRLMAAAALGPVVMLPGAWTCKSIVETPNGALIIGSPEVIITAVGLPTSAVADAVFVHDAFYPAVPFNTTLSAAPTFGSTILSMNAAPSVGMFVSVIAAIGGFDQFTIYQVKHVSGGGPFLVTVDRPVVWPYFTVGIVVEEIVNVASNIRILGGGMTIVGGGERCIEFLGSFDCLVEDVVVDWQGTGSGDFLCSFNTGGVRNTWRRIRTFNGLGTGIAHESQEYSTAEDCYAYEFLFTSTAGIGINDSYGSEVLNCRAAGNHDGLGIGPDGGNGCYETVVDGGAYDGNTRYGIFAFSGTTSIVGVKAGYNNVNLIVGDGGTTPLTTSVAIEGCTLHDAQGISSSNLFIGNSGSVSISDTDVSTSVVATVFGLFAQTGTNTPPQIEIHGVTCNGGGLIGTALHFEQFCNVDAHGVYVTGCTVSAIVCGNFAGGQGVIGRFTDVHYQAPAGGFGFQVGYACNVRLLNVVVDSDAGGGTGLEAGDSVVRIGPGCSFDVASIPVGLFAGAVTNRWTFSAAGGPLTVPFPITTNVSETVLFERTGGGTGLSPTMTRVAGTSVTVTAQAGDATTTGNVTVL